MKAFNDAGEEIDVFSAEEMEAQKSEAMNAKTEADKAKAEIAEAKAEVENLKKVTAEKTDNFKRLNEMSEKEKEAYSARELENMKRVEAAEARSKALEDKFNENENSRMNTTKENAMMKYHGGNKELKEALEKNYNLINLVGTSDETILERVRLAANMEKGKMGSNNPLFANLSGDAPRIKEKDTKDKFFESDKAKKALELMGDKPAK